MAQDVAALTTGNMRRANKRRQFVATNILDRGNEASRTQARLTRIAGWRWSLMALEHPDSKSIPS
ncbi:hypothetical protein VE04_07218, partial [Pseudogymnoascus sp. 24MN13]